jgi:hypothetical protein
MTAYFFYAKPVRVSNIVICCISFLLLFTLTTGLTCKPTQTVNLPAGDLDVTITVIDVDKTPSDGKVPVIVQFFSNGSYVKLTSAAVVTCNGVTLTDNGLGYAERINMIAPGGVYTIRHNRGGTITTANVTVPARPVITAPAAGANVNRTASFTINYIAGSGSGIRGSGSDANSSQGGTVQADNGAYTGLNLSGLQAGAGAVSITREFELTVPSGFKSAKVKYSCSNGHAVNWN